MSEQAAQAPESPQKQLDRILYLASLVSNRQQIEPTLELLRELTATKISGDTPLTPPDAATLDRIENDLTQYLIVSEPLREFTAESLQQHIYERWEAKGLIRRLRWQVAAILGVSVLLVVGILLMTFEPASLRRDIALISGATGCYLGGLLLFLSALRRFSSAIRTVYRLFCAGFFIGSISILVNAGLTFAFAYQDAPSWHWQELWFLNLGLYAEFVPLYIASIKLAKLQGIQSIAMKGWLVAFLAVGGAAVLAFTPAGRAIEPAGGLIAAFTWISCILSFASAVLIRRTWKSYTTLYRAPSRALWLTISLGTIVWAGFTFAPFFSESVYQAVSNISNLFFIAATAALVRAGYLFNKLSRY